MENVLIDNVPMKPRDWAVDAAIAAIAFLLGCAQLLMSTTTIFFQDETFRNLIGFASVAPSAPAYLMLALTTVPLVARRRFSWLTFGFIFAIFLIAQNAFHGYSLAIIGPVIAIFTVANQRPKQEIVVACAIAALGVLLVRMDGRNDSMMLLVRVQNLSYMALGVVAGIALQTYESYLAEAERRAAEAEKSREEEAARRVEEERVRIAREIHDITAHSLTAVSIQAAAAERLIDRDPASAKDAIKQVRSTSKSALEEIRSMIGVLRNEGQKAETRPTEGTDRLGDLCEYARKAGLKVSLEQEDYDKADVAVFIDVALFGIAREAVTNVVRHAQAQNLAIRISTDGGRAHLIIEDDGRGMVGDLGRQNGHGLQGMEERAHVLHGTFEAGNRKHSGFRVRVSIPLAEREMNE